MSTATAEDAPVPIPGGCDETTLFPNGIPRRENLVDFERIYATYSRQIYSLCLRMVGNPMDAEDLTQEAFLRVFRKMHTFRGDSSLKTWLHRVVVNVVLMWLRRKWHTETSLEEMTEADERTGNPGKPLGGPDHALIGTVDRVTLERALRQLPPGFRLVFTLHDVQGLGHDEAAAILGIKAGTSKSQLHKARLRLRELLGAAPSKAAVE